MTKVLRTLPFFLVLLPVFYLLHLLNEYFRILSFSDLLRLQVSLLIFVPLLFFASFVFLPPRYHKWAVVFLLFECLYFFFGPIVNTIKELSGSFGKYTVLLPVLFCVVLLLCLLILKRNRPYHGLFYFVNFLFLVLTVFEITRLVVLHTTNGQGLVKRQSEEISNYRKCNDCEKPDIYFLIFDGYSRRDLLKSFWNYDNVFLDSFLVKHGFRIIEKSKSNYNSTSLSLSSELDMRYHPELEKKSKFQALSFLDGMRRLEVNTVSTLLRAEGYKFSNHSIFYTTHDKFKPEQFIIDFPPEIIFSQTLVFRLVEDIGWNFNVRHSSAYLREMEQSVDYDLKRSIRTFDRVAQELNDTGAAPKFVYGHFLLPHSPYLFDSAGNVYPKNEIHLEGKDHGRYLQQLVYTNHKMQSLVSKLLSNKRKKIIIIQSDHGYRFYGEEYPKDWMFRNLSAIYFPDKNYNMLYDSMTNVNTFRVVFNQFFKQKFPLLKDSTVYLRVR